MLAQLTIHFSIITLKENIQEKELTIYNYICKSNKSTVDELFITQERAYNYSYNSSKAISLAY